MTTTLKFRWCVAAAIAIALGVFLAAPVGSAGKKVVIVQTNSAGDNVHIIDPATNKVIGTVEGIEVNHGAALAPDGTRLYVSNEALSTLDIVDGKTLKVIKQVPLSGHPNNLAIGKDGKRVYVGIIQAPGGVDVIDTASMQRVKTLPTKGTIHNAYVTPDGKYVVAGSIQGKTINVFDAAYPDDLRHRVTSLAHEAGHAVPPYPVLAECLVALAVRWREIGEGKATAILDEWRRRSPSAVGSPWSRASSVAVSAAVRSP